LKRRSQEGVRRSGEEKKMRRSEGERVAGEEEEI
jgi:hypothetical protein